MSIAAAVNKQIITQSSRGKNQALAIILGAKSTHLQRCISLLLPKHHGRQIALQVNILDTVEQFMHDQHRYSNITQKISRFVDIDFNICFYGGVMMIFDNCSTDM